MSFFFLKNLAVLDQVDSIEDLKKNIRKFDAEWHSLVEEMELSEEFQNQHQETIIRFLCRNGACIARTYANGLDKVQRKSFYRVVKAELMGQLHMLKYFEGDLQCELGAPLTEQVQTGWSKNESFTRDNMEVRECDDFFQQCSWEHNPVILVCRTLMAPIRIVFYRHLIPTKKYCMCL